MRALIVVATLLVTAAPADAACRRDPAQPPVTVKRFYRLGPKFDAQVAISRDGLLAWVRRRGTIDRLLIAPGGGWCRRLLDKAGSIADLSFTGTRLDWTHDGAARTADLDWRRC